MAVLFSSVARPAAAHERRTVAGLYTFVAGFIAEPVFLEEPNGIDLRVSDAQSNEPIEGVEKTLKADITAGGQTKTVELRARFGQKGAYTSDVIPTKDGQWVFRFYGTVNGTAIDERFESGPGRFNEPQSKAALQFPVQQPSVADLAARLERGQPAESGQASGTAPDVQRALDRADDARNTAITFGLAGVGIGVLGTVLAAYALLSRRNRGVSGSTGGRSEPL